jgi:hypothetical protein
MKYIIKTVGWAIRHPQYAWAWYRHGKPYSAVHAASLLLAAGLLLTSLTGCLTSKNVTTNPDGTLTTNTVVNTGQLTIDCAVVQLNTAIGVSFAVQKDPAIIPTLKDVSAALDGILHGATTNSANQILALVDKGNKNPVISANIGPVVQQASDLEQQLVKKYGATASGQIVIAVATAFNAGLTAGLAGK